MKRLVMIIAATALLIGGLVFYTNNESNQSISNVPAATKVVEQKPISISEEIKSVDGQLIDVREPEEYEESRADGSVNIPLGNILNGDFSKIDADKPIYVYCRSGNRSGQAKVALEKAGYKNIINIGGLAEWEKQGEKVCGVSTSESC